MRSLPDRVWKLPRHEDDEAAEEGMGRILALSDGVFAIAITLLILEIAVPATTGDADLSKALLGLWPRYLAYVLSFVVIARFWMTHHLAFRLIAPLRRRARVAQPPVAHVRGVPAVSDRCFGRAQRVAASGGSVWGRGGLGRSGVRGLLVVRIRARKTAEAGRRACARKGPACPWPVGPGVLRADAANCCVRSLCCGSTVDLRIPAYPDRVRLVLG